MSTSTFTFVLANIFWHQYLSILGSVDINIFDFFYDICHCYHLSKVLLVDIHIYRCLQFSSSTFLSAFRFVYIVIFSTLIFSIFFLLSICSTFAWVLQPFSQIRFGEIKPFGTCERRKRRYDEEFQIKHQKIKTLELQKKLSIK